MSQMKGFPDAFMLEVREMRGRRAVLALGAFSVVPMLLSLVLLGLLSRNRPLQGLSVPMPGVLYRSKRWREPRWCHPEGLHLLDRPGIVTALASFPGSGNTWLRYLLQQATGYMTGSVYSTDMYLRDHGFPGEGIQNGSVSVVKTHEGDWDGFDRALLLIRDPGPAIQAEFNRRYAGHLRRAPEEAFRRQDGRGQSNMYILRKVNRTQ
ncbi:unnamed protein product [Darwinula stevensoni]|uniref:Uncharacterized protein n=1 Tax=Darwinula stevensoni TaxID=69355 RepID=A0A7R9AH07_9CRUS|nr:unnamed protein product [Darwinula stevensoni]CAG0904629.1 unnamed protein product [Darwinula stevensoni]